MKVRTLSRVYPSYHPKAGQPTQFVEKIHWGMAPAIHAQFGTGSDMIHELNKHLPEKIVQDFIDTLDDDSDFRDIIKHHTIRAGHHFNPGDWFSPRVWSGAPYNSKQIIIAPPIQVKKTWDFVNAHPGFIFNGRAVVKSEMTELALNDGLSVDDLIEWFNKPFDGQVICWNPSINY